MDPVNQDPRHHHCKECGAVGATCCDTAKARLETADGLGILVKRQSDQITVLRRELGEARQVIADLRRTWFVMKDEYGDYWLNIPNFSTKIGRNHGPIMTKALEAAIAARAANPSGVA